MFSKKESGSAIEQNTMSDRPRTQPQQQHMPSIISEGVEIVGDMTGENEIQVDGSVRGNLKAKRVMVGRTGLVDGSIKADSVIIAGNVVGDTNAKDVTLEASARIKGGVTVGGDLSMAAGARLEGKVTMKGADEAEKVSTGERNTIVKPNGSGSKPSGMSSGAKSDEAGMGRPAA